MHSLTPQWLSMAHWQGGDAHSAFPAADHPMIWQARISAPEPSEQKLDTLLMDDERFRRDRFKLRPDQQRFAVGRAWLRILLGMYLGLPPRQVILQYGEHGKPYVQCSLQTPALHFNVAHSGDVVLLAFHPRCEVGVDVEQMEKYADLATVAAQLFSTAELEAWASLNDAQQQATFFEAWTRREAGLKAIGCGFAIERPPEWDSQMTVYRIDLPPGYAGSVAVLSRPQKKEARLC